VDLDLTVLVQVVISGLLLGGLYALASIGLNIIYGVMDFINFAHGEFLMVGMYFSYILWESFHIDPLLSLLLSIAFFFFVGTVIQRGAIDLALKSPKPALSVVCVTFGMSILLKGLITAIFGANYLSIRTAYSGISIDVFGIRFGLPQIISFTAAVCITILVYTFFIKTDIGIAIRATMQDKEAASIFGIDTRKIYAISFAVGVTLTAFAGILLSIFYYIFPEVGSVFAATCYVVVVLGGLGSFSGAFVGGLIIGVIESLSGFFLLSSIKQMIGLIIFIVILLLKPQGLFGGK
jgi:branched-chain amino acid transport system permease protein